MRRAFVVAALAALAVSSCSATLRMSATAPVLDNDGACTSPVLYPAPTGAVRVVHFSWTGPVAGQDSVTTTVGVLATLTVTVPPGTYTVHGWASGPGTLAGCDTVITRTVTASPWHVSFQ